MVTGVLLVDSPDPASLPSRYTVAPCTLESNDIATVCTAATTIAGWIVCFTIAGLIAAPDAAPDKKEDENTHNNTAHHIEH